MSLQNLKATPLLEAHRREKCKLVPFAGWQMPIEYRGILEEHRAVRSDKGLFDLSHMGEIEVTGTGALKFLQELVTNDVASLTEGQALYTVMCNEDGGILDDMVIYNLPGKFLLVVNASNTDKIFSWMRERKGNAAVSLSNKSDETALISLQGPNVEAALQPLTKTPLSPIRYYHGLDAVVASIPVLLSRTGYTGEDGFELYVEAGRAEKLWTALRETGALPIGLGARDTLRLEAAYLLYGNDMDEKNNPLEAGLSWVVKFNKENFVGKKTLLALKEKGLNRKLAGFVMQDRAVPRSGYAITAGEHAAGAVTSGTFSPTLGKGIGLGYVEALSSKEGTPIGIEIRGETHPASIAKRPFVQGSVKRGS